MAHNQPASESQLQRDREAMRVGVNPNRIDAEVTGSSTKILAYTVATNLTIIVGTGAAAFGYCLYKSDDPGALMVKLVGKLLGNAEAAFKSGGVGSLKFNIVAKTKEASDEILASYCSGEMLRNMNGVLLTYAKQLGFAEFNSIDLVKFEKFTLSNGEFMTLKQQSGKVISNFTKEILNQDCNRKIDDVAQVPTMQKPKLLECFDTNALYDETKSKELNAAVYHNGAKVYFLPVLLASFMHSIVDYNFGWSKKIIREISGIVKNDTSSSLAEVVDLGNKVLYVENNPGLSFLYFNISAELLRYDVFQNRIECISVILSGLKDAVLKLVKLEFDLKYVIDEVMPLMASLQNEIPECRFDLAEVRKGAEIISSGWIAECYMAIGDNCGRKRAALKGIKLMEVYLEQKDQCDESLEVVYVVLLNHCAEACDGPTDQESRQIYFEKAIDFCKQVLNQSVDNQPIEDLLFRVENNFYL